MTRRQVWTKAPLVAEVVAEAQARVALLHLEATQPVVLEGTAAAIWMMIDGQRSEDQIVAEIGENFPDVGPEICAHVNGFLRSLADQSLIEEAELRPPTDS